MSGTEHATLPGPVPDIAPAADDPAGDHRSAPATSSRVSWLTERPWRMIVLAAVVAIIPAIVTLVRLAGRHWYPTGDMAQAELHVRGFWHSPPLVGAAGRIESDAGVQGSHPGPSLWFLLYPVYALLGRTSFGLMVSVTAVNLASFLVALWLAFPPGWRGAAAARCRPPADPRAGQRTGVLHRTVEPVDRRLPVPRLPAVDVGGRRRRGRLPPARRAGRQPLHPVPHRLHPPGRRDPRRRHAVDGGGGVAAGHDRRNRMLRWLGSPPWPGS